MKFIVVILVVLVDCTHSLYKCGINDILCNDECMINGVAIYSRSAEYKVYIQADIYLLKKTHPSPGVYRWATNTIARNVVAHVDKLFMQTDGNLVLYNGNIPLWASNTYNGGLLKNILHM